MRVILILISLLMGSVGLSQQHEFDLKVRFGTPTKNYSITEPVVDGFYSGEITRMRSRYDIGTVFSYHYQVWKRAKLYATAGVELSQAKHYLPIVDPNWRHLESVPINSSRMALQLGVKKRWSFMEDRLHLDLGLRIVDRFPLKEEVTYASDYKFNNEDWIEYKYEIKTMYGGYQDNDNTVKNKNYIDLNTQFDLDMSFNVNPRLKLMLGFSYTRNNYFYYNYNYSIRYYYNGSPTPNDSFEFLDAFPTPYGKLDHYLYLNAGISYNLKQKRLED